MALLYWLPLITDSRNQGLIDAEFTNTNVAFTGSGKLGKSAVFDGTSALQANVSAIGNKWAVCCWAKLNASDSSQMIFQIGTGSSYTSTQTGIHSGASNTNYIIILNNGASHKITMAVNYTDWVHYCFMSDGTDITLFINGSQVYTTADNESKVVGTRISIGAYYSKIVPANGMIQDFRVYNTAISPHLVKFLSQGLVLHYPLDHDGVGGDNVLTNSSFSKNLTGWTANGTNNGIVLQDGYRCLHIPGALKTTKSIRQNITSAVSDKSTDQLYTISADIRVDNIVRGTTNPMCEFYFGGSYDKNGTSAWLGATYISGTKEFYDLSNTGWHRLHVVARFANVPTNMDAYIYVRDITGDVYIKNMKFELGDTATPWCPNSVDTQYAELGLNSDIEYDVSGYGHNATKMGELTYKSVSPKYGGCTHMSATNQKIHISDLQTSGFNNSYTFSWWGKRSSNTPMFWGFSNGIRLNGMYNGNLWNTGDGTKNPLYNIGTTTQVTEPSVNVWHHYAMTGNGTKCYVYLDGELWAEAKTYKSISGTSIYINGWDNSNSYASDNMDIADFRIYATALSAEDVAELYHTPISLANDGTLFAAQFVES